jgi:hypothetical protein
MTSPTADKIDPTRTMKTHVSEMSPAERLAMYDARAREANAGLAPVTPSEPEPKKLTFENLCGVVLDVVKDFTAKGYHPTTISPDHVVEKARQRFPDGVTLVGEEVSIEDTPDADPLRLDRVKGADEGGGDGMTEGGNPIGSEAAAEEVTEANEKAAPKKKTAAPKGPPAKKAPKRKPAGPSPTPKS